MGGRRFARLLSILLALCALCGCAGRDAPSSDSPSAGEALSTQEAVQTPGGRLTILACVNEDVAREVVARFSRATGYEVSFVCVPAVQARELLLSDPSQADVFWGATADVHKQLGDRGLLLRYSGGEEKIERFYLDPQQEWQPVSVEILSIGVNPRAAVRALGEDISMPTTLEELASPMYKGLLVLPDPNTSYSGTLLASSILRSHGEEGGMALLEALWRNAGEFAQTDLVAAQKAGLGVYPITVGYYSDQLRVAQAGFPLEANVYSGAGWSVSAVSVMAAGANWTEAMAFRAFTLTPEIQELMGTLGQSVSPRGDIRRPAWLDVTVLDFPVSSPARVNATYAKEEAIRDLFRQIREESVGVIFADERQPAPLEEEELP